MFCKMWSWCNFPDILESETVNSTAMAKPCQLPSGSANEPEIAGIEVVVPIFPSQNPLLTSALKIFGAETQGKQNPIISSLSILSIEEHRETTTLDHDRDIEHRRWDCFTAIAWKVRLVQRAFVSKWRCSSAITLTWWPMNVSSVLKPWAQEAWNLFFTPCFDSTPVLLTARTYHEW